MSRRKFLKIITASGAIGLLGACEHMPGSAIAPWNGPESAVTDPRLRALSWALLAPNPHNLQAWVADVRQSNVINLYIDARRLLPATDPFSRQVLIGCGAFLETLCIAASAEGYRAETVLMPKGVYGKDGVDKRPFARVMLHQDRSMKRDPLFTAIGQRRTNRGVYEPTPPDAGTLTSLAAANVDAGISVSSTRHPAQVARLNAMTLAGYQIEFGKTETWQESANTLRIGAQEVQDEPSGTPLLGMQIWWGRRLGMVNRAALLDTKGIGPRTALQALEAVLTKGTSAWIWLSSADNSRIAQIEVGRAYMRLCLQATQLGLAMHPNSQVLQELPEMQGLLTQVHGELGVPSPARIQMLARIGYASATPATPRRPLSRLLLT